MRSQAILSQLKVLLPRVFIGGDAAENTLSENTLSWEDAEARFTTSRELAEHSWWGWGRHGPLVHRIAGKQGKGFKRSSLATEMRSDAGAVVAALHRCLPPSSAQAARRVSAQASLRDKQAWLRVGLGELAAEGDYRSAEAARYPPPPPHVFVGAAGGLKDLPPDTLRAILSAVHAGPAGKEAETPSRVDPDPRWGAVDGAPRRHPDAAQFDCEPRLGGLRARRGPNPNPGT